MYCVPNIYILIVRISLNVRVNLYVSIRIWMSEFQNTIQINRVFRVWRWFQSFQSGRLIWNHNILRDEGSGITSVRKDLTVHLRLGLKGETCNLKLTRWSKRSSHNYISYNSSRLHSYSKNSTARTEKQRASYTNHKIWRKYRHLESGLPWSYVKIQQNWTVRHSN